MLARTSTSRSSPGKRVALVGATGAGKTTIISLLMRFYDVARRDGSRVDGKDVREWDLEALRSSMALVLQDVHLVQRHDRVQHPARLRDPDRARARGGRGRGREPLHREAAAGLRHRGQRARRDALGGAEAAAVLRARPRPRPARADPGRGHLVGRHRDRAADPGGARGADAGPHRDRDRAPALDGAERGRDPGAAQGPDPRARHAPGAAGAARDVLEALPAPVQGPGAGADRHTSP